MGKLIKDISNSEWDYSKIEKELLSQIKGDNNGNCIRIIEKYGKIINEHFKEENNVNIFVKKLNDLLVNTTNVERFYAGENILKNEIFHEVLNKFNESDVLIRACQRINVNTIKWIINHTKVNLCVTDKNGMTALMHAVEHWPLVFMVEKLLKNNKESCFIRDNHGNTALFHSIHNYNIFNRVLYTTKDIDSLNNNKESIIYYCGKNEIYISFDDVLKIENINIKPNPEIFIEEGIRMFPKLVENGQDKLLKYLAMQYIALSSVTEINILKSIVDAIGETLFCILIKKYYEIYMAPDKELFSNFICVLKILIFDLECNVNCVIDEEGNTPLMFFLLIEDYNSANYMLSSKNEIDLSIKNKHGISASYLSLFIKKEEKKLSMKFLEHPSFDNFYLDEHKDNLITHFIVRDGYDEALQILSKSKYLLTVPNKNGENTITIAIKSGHSDILQDEFFQNEGFNLQDQLGNTPLHYALELKDKYAIILLSYYGADTTIKNNEGKIAMDIANEINDAEIFELLKNPEEILKKKHSKVKRLFSKFSSKDKASSSSKESSKESLSTNDGSNKEINTVKAKNDEQFNNILKKNKKIFNSSNNINNKYIKDYNYLIRRNKTIYSISNNGALVIKNLKDYYLIYKTVFNYIPFYWTYYLSTCAYISGYHWENTNKIINNINRKNLELYANSIPNPESPGDYIKGKNDWKGIGLISSIKVTYGVDFDFCENYKNIVRIN